MHSYREKVCLIQVSDGQECWLIDSLALDADALGPLWEALDGKELILHDCDYDLRMLRDLAAFRPAAVFDTMIAARLAGCEGIGFAALVESFFGVALPKTSQKADWSQRPLPEKMLEYARNDVLHLHPLKERLSARLRELGRWDWYEQSLARYVQGTEEGRAENDNAFWRINNKPRFSGRALAMLWTLWLWREDMAQAADVPPFRIMRSSQMVDAVEAIMEKRKPRTFLRDKAQQAAFDEAVQRGWALPKDDWPRREIKRGIRKTDGEEALFEELKQLRNAAAERLGLDAGLVASNARLQAAARLNGDLEEELLPWQREVLGIARRDDLEALRAEVEHALTERKADSGAADHG